jgi:hypothetical protein
MSATRIGPATGYNGGRKRHYRRDVWATFRRALPIPRAAAHALLMPSSEGDEVNVAIANGFRESHLHLVDDNPAIAAHLKRRFRRATCHGVNVVAAAERLARQGERLDVANLDLCGCTDGVERIVREFIETDVMSDQSVIAVTLLRGRERKFWPHVNGYTLAQRDCPVPPPLVDVGLAEHEPGLNDRVRIGRVAHAIESACRPREIEFLANVARWSTYRSEAGTQTMLWAVFCLAAITPGRAILEQRWELMRSMLRRMPESEHYRVAEQYGDQIARWQLHVLGGEPTLAWLRRVRVVPA